MNTSTHLVAPEEVMALLDGELSGEQARVTSAHVEGCAECQEIAASLRNTSESLAGWLASAPANPKFEKRLAENARAASDRRNRSFPWHLWGLPGWRVCLTWAGGAAAVVVAALLALGPVRVENNFDAWMGTRSQTKHVETVDVAPYAAARAAPDSNGMFHGLGVRAQNPFSAEGNFGGTVGKLREDRELAQAEQESGSRNWSSNGPMIARTISLSLIATDFNSARASLDNIVARHHGYAANLSASMEQNAARSLQASLRVPAPELGAVLAELKTLGRLLNEAQSGEEVTQQHADLVARLKNARETEVRLQDILRNRTGKISDVLAVEQEIARVRGEIEQMQAEQQSLEHRVSFASIDLHLAEDYKAELGTPSPSVSTRLHNAAVAGFRSALEAVVGIVLFFAEYGPSLVIWLAVLFPPAWLLWRRWRRAYALASSRLA